METADCRDPTLNCTLHTEGYHIQGDLSVSSAVVVVIEAFTRTTVFFVRYRLLLFPSVSGDRNLFNRGGRTVAL